ncbi:MAG: hypothetical protein RMY64_08090 [Nostoc sp. DedQUE08]|uniref:hypothetical protein n=1 Tax=Nostoc sp. DedQUE08 TaxID=3075393 RepID=UPI002AD3681A|nr:hypothetical protein [Nostoc sp. DedQUE08]MDZ8065587.1 hypothetical protein [Nostoc sp. DedQUE08]
MCTFQATNHLPVALLAEFCQSLQVQGFRKVLIWKMQTLMPSALKTLIYLEQYLLL